MNKGVLIGTGVVIFVVLLFIFIRKNPEQILVKEGPIVIVGDSLVAGVGASKDNDIASVLSGRLGEKVINAGISGDTTEGVLERLDRDVLVHNPRIVVVIIGGNDFLRRVPKEKTLGNVESIIDKIKSAGSVTILVGIDTLVYNSSYRSIAGTYNIPFIPNLLGSVRKDSTLMSDTIHPNDEGYLIFADEIEKELRGILE
jgi:lysophospholipase L1-like esterase